MKKLSPFLTIALFLASISPTLTHAQIDSYCDPVYQPIGVHVNNVNGFPRILTGLVLPNGKVVLGGAFTSPTNSVLTWDPANNTVTPFGQGINGDVWSLALMPDGSIIAGGTFPGGVSRWNGTNWQTMGTGEDNVLALAVMPDGTLVAGNSGSPGHIDRWNGTAWVSMNDGLGSSRQSILRLFVSHDGQLYAGGNGPLMQSGSGIAKWNGASWEEVGAGLTYEVRDIAEIGPDHKLVATGLLFRNTTGDPSINNLNVTATLGTDGTWQRVALGASGVYGGTTRPRGYKLYPRTDDIIMVAGDFNSVVGLTPNGIGQIPGTSNLVDLKFLPRESPTWWPWLYAGMGPFHQGQPGLDGSILTIGNVDGEIDGIVKLQDGRILIMGFDAQTEIPTITQAFTMTFYKPGDFNCSGAVSQQDLFSFLQAWFGGDPHADFNRDNVISNQDIYDFLAAWFAN